ncbi:hypothetical protein [Rhodococcus globerulus]|uniref:Uncharacterized protein n=1 Tax=Rhodococcus globerulus TaxID=33008 RepID=A0ABU4C3N7_RHOGO|nr:hypothetical protein [Rhodococcus globerulus]MDV6271115.1 hypothetical protein [Rhodococcus globerulus]
MTSPDPTTPEGFFNGLGGLAAFSTKTREEYEEEWFGKVATSTSKLVGFHGILEGFKTAIGNRIDALLGRVDNFEDGQLALNGRVDLLSPMQDYASAYANTAGGISAAGQFGFTNQVGPLKNAHLSGGKLVLDDYGLWDIQCQIWCDFTLLDGMVEWEIRVLKPDNTIFSRTRARLDSKAIFSSTNLASVVVPAVGYQVQIYINEIAPGRGVIGGPTFNRLTVKHISRNTTTGDTGA